MLVKLNKMGVTQIGQGITLKPGVNEVDGKLWKDAVSHPVVKLMIEEGDLEEITKADAKKEEKAKVVSEMSPKAAKELISATTDVEILQGWLESEQRTSVKKAIYAQIKEIKAPPKYRGSDDNGEDKAEFS